MSMSFYMSMFFGEAARACWNKVHCPAKLFSLKLNPTNQKKCESCNVMHAQSQKGAW